MVCYGLWYVSLPRLLILRCSKDADIHKPKRGKVMPSYHGISGITLFKYIQVAEQKEALSVHEGRRDNVIMWHMEYIGSVNETKQCIYKASCQSHTSLEFTPAPPWNTPWEAVWAVPWWSDRVDIAFKSILTATCVHMQAWVPCPIGGTFMSMMSMRT